MEDEEESYDKRYTLAGIDKLDWRRRIDEQMWRCIQAKGRYGIYHGEVLKLEDCICTNFYGLDFRTPITAFIIVLDETLAVHIDRHLETAYRYHPETIEDLTIPDKGIFVKKIYFQYWGHRFKFDRDLLAKNRGLLWGSQKLPGGEEMEDKEEREE